MVFNSLKWLTLLQILNMCRQIHSKMVYRILHCKINEFFELLPIGMIINRFSSDIFVIDMQLIFTNLFLTNEACGLLFDVVVIFHYTNIFSLIFITIFIIISIHLHRKYMSCKRELLRQELITRSPIAGLINDVLKGLPEIRAMSLKNYFKGK